MTKLYDILSIVDQSDFSCKKGHKNEKQTV